jgi:CRP-like cAMP-binding protein
LFISSLNNEIVKERGMPLASVFVILSGKLAVYDYPFNRKAEYKILKSKDLVGAYELNFIAPKSAQYEALTDVEVIKFPKFEYERIMLASESELRKTKLEYLQNNFYLFANIKEDRVFRLAKKTKMKIFQKDEVVVPRGTKPDCLFIVREGSFRAEKYVTISDRNIWPVDIQLWECNRINRNILFTALNMEQNSIFGAENLKTGKVYEYNIVANTDNAVLYILEKNQLESLIPLDELRQMEDVQFPSEEQIQQQIRLIELG